MEQLIIIAILLACIFAVTRKVIKVKQGGGCGCGCGCGCGGEQKREQGESELPPCCCTQQATEK